MAIGRLIAQTAQSERMRPTLSPHLVEARIAHGADQRIQVLTLQPQAGRSTGPQATQTRYSS